MIYRLLKKTLGVSRIDSLFEINTNDRILDMRYVSNYGFFFISQNSHAIGLLTLDGKLDLSWAGRTTQNGNDDGHRGLFEHPLALAYSKNGNNLIVLDNHGMRIRSIDLSTKYVRTSVQGVLATKLEKIFSSVNFSPTTVCCDTDGHSIFWTIKEFNKIFRYTGWKNVLDVYMGNGKGGFSVSHDLQQSMLKAPTSIRYKNDNLFMCDSGNHCIRMISLKNNTSNVIAGNPTVKGDNELLLSYPTKLSINGDIVYFSDCKKLKQLSLNDRRITIIREFENEFLIDSEKSLYILERLT